MTRTGRNSGSRREIKTVKARWPIQRTVAAAVVSRYHKITGREVFNRNWTLGCSIKCPRAKADCDGRRVGRKILLAAILGLHKASVCVAVSANVLKGEFVRVVGVDRLIKRANQIDDVGRIVLLDVNLQVLAERRQVNVDDIGFGVVAKTDRKFRSVEFLASIVTSPPPGINIPRRRYCRPGRLSRPV